MATEKNHKKVEAELQDSALRLFRILLKVGRVMDWHSQRSSEASGLCPTDFYILEALYHKGALSAGQLAEKVLITLGSMSSALDRLEGKGLLERHVSAADKRGRLVFITDSGKQLVASTFPAHAAALTRAMSALSREEMEQAALLLKKLGKGAEAYL